jgi:hypothetical protein
VLFLERVAKLTYLDDALARGRTRAAVPDDRPPIDPRTARMHAAAAARRARPVGRRAWAGIRVPRRGRRFDRDEGVTGARFDLEPTASWAWRRPGHVRRALAALRATGLSLEDAPGAGRLARRARADRDARRRPGLRAQRPDDGPADARAAPALHVHSLPRPVGHPAVRHRPAGPEPRAAVPAATATSARTASATRTSSPTASRRASSPTSGRQLLEATLGQIYYFETSARAAAGRICRRGPARRTHRAARGERVPQLERAARHAVDTDDDRPCVSDFRLQYRPAATGRERRLPLPRGRSSRGRLVQLAVSTPRLEPVRQRVCTRCGTRRDRFLPRPAVPGLLLAVAGGRAPLRQRPHREQDTG